MTLLDTPLPPAPSASMLAATLEIAYLRRLLESLDEQRKLALDVGAHKGDVTQVLADLGFKVLAVEPQDYMADRFAKRHANRMTTGTVLLSRCAVSDHTGEADLIIGSASTVSTLEPLWTSVAFPDEFKKRRSVRVALRPLADLLAEEEFGPVGFAKIDVEGHELPALRGLLRPGVTPPLAIMFEACQCFATPAIDCLAFLRSQGYRTFDIFVRIGEDLITAERFTDAALPPAWNACGGRFFYANIIGYHASMPPTVTMPDPGEFLRNHQSGNDRGMGGPPMDSLEDTCAAPVSPIVTPEPAEPDFVSFPSPGIPGEGRVRVFSRNLADEFPSPQPSPGVPGEGARNQRATELGPEPQWFVEGFTRFRNLVSSNNRGLPVKWEERQPLLDDRTARLGFDRHYIYHTAWAARILSRTKPARHVDVSSTLYFCAIVSAFVPVDYYEFRPVNLALDNLSTGVADLQHLPFADRSVQSISCMHVVEHIGLGRYGDPIDPDGDLKAIAELGRVLAPGGSLLLVVPVGRPRVIFNAHRIYSTAHVRDACAGLDLAEFALIPDGRHDLGLVHDPSDEFVNSQNYGCGCFWFRRNSQ